MNRFDDDTPRLETRGHVMQTLHKDWPEISPEKIASAILEGRKDSRKDAENIVHAYLHETLGDWYWSWRRIGNEILGGCLCHAFRDAMARSPQAGAAWVFEELRLIRDLLEELDAYYESVGELTGADDWDDAIEGVYEIVVRRTSCNESWYAVLISALEWLFESAGGAAAAGEWMQQRLNIICSSWMEPDVAQWKTFKLGALVRLTNST